MDMLSLRQQDGQEVRSPEQQVEQVVPPVRTPQASTWNVGVRMVAAVITVTLAFMVFEPIDAMLVTSFMVAVAK